MNSLPLGDADGLGPALYIDGTNANPWKSDCCIVWFVRPIVPKKNPKKKDDAIEAVEDAGEKDDDAPTSKARPTHKVIFKDFIVQIPTMKGG